MHKWEMPFHAPRHLNYNRRKSAEPRHTHRSWPHHEGPAANGMCFCSLSSCDLNVRVNGAVLRHPAFTRQNHHRTAPGNDPVRKHLQHRAAQADGVKVINPSSTNPCDLRWNSR